VRELKSRKSPTARKISFSEDSRVATGLIGVGGCPGGSLLVGVIIVVDVVVVIEEVEGRIRGGDEDQYSVGGGHMLVRTLGQIDC